MGALSVRNELSVSIVPVFYCSGVHDIAVLHGTKCCGNRGMGTDDSWNRGNMVRILRM